MDDAENRQKPVIAKKHVRKPISFNINKLVWLRVFAYLWIFSLLLQLIFSLDSVFNNQLF